jgi:phosphoribosylamine-glycine ligase
VFYKQIVIEGVEGDVTISHTDDGAAVSAGGRVLCQVGRRETPEQRFAKAYEVAKVVCGADRRGRVAATNSMVCDVMTEIERVAGC